MNDKPRAPQPTRPLPGGPHRVGLEQLRGSRLAYQPQPQPQPHRTAEPPHIATARPQLQPQALQRRTPIIQRHKRRIRPLATLKIVKRIPLKIAVPIAICIVAIAAGALVLRPQTAGQQDSGTVAGQSQAPDFATLTARTGSGLAYDPLRRVASFTDAINGVPVTVSQQPLPERFKNNPADELAAFASEINASEVLAAGDVTAYSGLSAKGPQTVVFIKNELLVFVTASQEVPGEAVVGYIASLE